MPSTTPERAARWPGMDSEAMAYLRSKGWKLQRTYLWEKEGMYRPDFVIEPKEADAILYLVQEWDFGAEYVDGLSLKIWRAAAPLDGGH